MQELACMQKTKIQEIMDREEILHDQLVKLQEKIALVKEEIKTIKSVGNGKNKCLLRQINTREGNLICL